jgi:hypothetical protein
VTITASFVWRVSVPAVPVMVMLYVVLGFVLGISIFMAGGSSVGV